ncbi:AAA domain-containing protein [Fluviispira vulneris]|uniref:AAA domain-containing protein n=1 Tax=Fluviispira vulneris TaxID=2763012 RepID=UPI001645A533|nr:AAA domain-containing protein [Fluviispira vulneris]
MNTRSPSVLALQYWHQALIFSNMTKLANENEAIPFKNTIHLNSGKFEKKIIESDKFMNFFKDKSKGIVKFIHQDGKSSSYAETWICAGYKTQKKKMNVILSVPIFVDIQGNIISNTNYRPFLNSNYLEPVDEIYATSIKIGTLARYEKFLSKYPLSDNENELQSNEKLSNDSETHGKKLPNINWSQWWEYAYTMFLETYNSPEIENYKRIPLSDFLRSKSSDKECWYTLVSVQLGEKMNKLLRESYSIIERKIQNKNENFKNQYPLLHHISQDQFTQNILVSDAIEANTLHHTGHIDSFDEQERIRKNFPLDPSQREALLTFLSTPDGFPLAISGPPGTGKTSMLKAAIATLWVNKTIANNNPECPIVIASSFTNNATKNIIGNFSEIPGRIEEHLLLQRWVSGILSYGWYFPSEAKKEESQHLNLLHQNYYNYNSIYLYQAGGAAEELNLSKREQANREKRKFLTNINNIFNKDFIYMDQCVRFLHDSLKNQCQNILPKLYHSYKNTVKILINNDMNQLEASLHNIELLKNEIELEAKNKNFLENSYISEITDLKYKKNYLLGFFEKYINKINYTINSKYYKFVLTKQFVQFYLKIIKTVFFILLMNNKKFKKLLSNEKIPYKSSFKLQEIFTQFENILLLVNLKRLEYEREIVSFNSEITNINNNYIQFLEERQDKINDEIRNFKILEEFNNSILYILAQSKFFLLINKLPDQFRLFDNKIQSIYKMKDSLEKETAVKRIQLFESFQALLDCTIRTYNFHMTARYWEGRWLCTKFPEQKNSYKKSKDTQIDQLRSFCMLAPCIVSTFHIMPKLFHDKNNNVNFGNEADLLIIDEAGQCCLENSMVAFSFAKRALIVGDVKQLEPVFNLDNEAEHCIAKTLKLTDKEKEDISDREIMASKNNLMSVLQEKSYFTKPYSNGLMLTRHYRCVQNIIEFCNELVYDGDLIPVIKNKNSLFPSMGYVCHSFKASQKNGSWYNEDECLEILEWLKENEDKITNAYNPDGVIKIPFYKLVAVITPFKYQEKILKDKIHAEWSLRIKNPDQLELFKRQFVIGTVHSLQGAECPIVIFSLVSDREDGKTVFWDNKTNLLNVAVSRAKDSFLVFCHREFLFPEKVLSEKSNIPSVKLAKYLLNNGKPVYPTIAFVVESPNKIETIQKLLPKDYKVFATGGFFRELDLDAHDTMEKSISYPVWKIREERRFLINEIKIFSRDFDEIILATDNDREGELIAWHLKEYIRSEFPQKRFIFKRVRFNSIDKVSILTAIKNFEVKLNKNLIQSALIRNIYDIIYSQFIKYKALKLKNYSHELPFLSRNHLSVFKILQVQKEKSKLSGYTLRVKFSIKSRNKFLFGKSVSSNSLLSQQKIFQTLEAAEEYAHALTQQEWTPSPLYSLTKTLRPKSGMTTAETLKRVARMHKLSPEKTMEILQALYDGSAMIQSSTHNPNSHRFNFGGEF